jgi:DNA repair protein RecN (Recombination protein N)
MVSLPIGLSQNSNFQLKAGVVERSSFLEQLSIRSLGVIESAELEFTPGFTVLTGETGAGKTMVLTALGLILGAKSDADFVRTGSDRLLVSSRFRVPEHLHASVRELDGEIEDGEVLITRSVTQLGKSRITVGGAQVTATQVNALAGELVEVHAQSSTARLLKPTIQRELLDMYGDYKSELVSYEITFSEYKELSRRIKDLRKALQERDREIAELKLFVEDFTEANPQPGELSEIENELSKLGSVEAINSELTSALNVLEDEDQSAINFLQLARKHLESLRGKDVDLEPLLDRFLDSLYGVQEVSGELGRYMSALEANPARFEELQQRKSKLNTLLKKYGKGSERDAAYIQLLEDGQNAALKIADLTGGDARLAQMESELDAEFQKLAKAAKALTKARKATGEELSQLVSTELTALSMPHSQVIIEIESADSMDPKNFTDSGLDEIRFLFTSHTGAAPLPLSKAASGGELSRVMLSIEIVLAKNSPVGTYIFDEVDAGVGGKAAVEVGRRLHKLAQSSQVIVVTHLPQVAVWADNHLVVSKDESGSYSQSSVVRVENEARKREIARLLSGQDQSVSAQEHAAELLDLVQNSR